mmetsp:Transcript_119440/g.337982  ORF Transcript_119440/g.337982 Transcript_119440/m.337982 type:complete len:781 (+) Transcript_119440:70-2412(+)
MAACAKTPTTMKGEFVQRAVSATVPLEVSTTGCFTMEVDDAQPVACLGFTVKLPFPVLLGAVADCRRSAAQQRRSATVSQPKLEKIPLPRLWTQSDKKLAVAGSTQEAVGAQSVSASEGSRRELGHSSTHSLPSTRVGSRGRSRAGAAAPNTSPVKSRSRVSSVSIQMEQKQDAGDRANRSLSNSRKRLGSPNQTRACSPNQTRACSPNGDDALQALIAFKSEVSAAAGIPPTRRTLDDADGSAFTIWPGSSSIGSTSVLMQESEADAATGETPTLFRSRSMHDFYSQRVCEESMRRCSSHEASPQVRGDTSSGFLRKRHAISEISTIQPTSDDPCSPVHFGSHGQASSRCGASPEAAGQLMEHASPNHRPSLEAHERSAPGLVDREGAALEGGEAVYSPPLAVGEGAEPPHCPPDSMEGGPTEDVVWPRGAATVDGSGAMEQSGQQGTGADSRTPPTVASVRSCTPQARRSSPSGSTVVWPSPGWQRSRKSEGSMLNDIALPSNGSRGGAMAQSAERFDVPLEAPAGSNSGSGMLARPTALVGISASARRSIDRSTAAVTTVKALLRDMRQNLSTPEVQERCCVALTDFAGLSDAPHGSQGVTMPPQQRRPFDCSVLDARRAVIAYGGIDAVLQAMEKHRNSVSIQQAGSAVLRLFASADPSTCKKLAGHSEVVRALLDAMRSQPGSAAVQVNCFCALHSLATSSEDSKAMIKKQGGIHEAVAAMRLHASTPQVQERCCLLICSLVPLDVEDNRLLAEVGGMDAVIKAMRKFHAGGISM